MRYASLIAVTIVLGLASRKFSSLLPWWLAKNAGDILYATLAYWLVGFIFPALTPLRTALATAAFCAGIEFLKFSEAPWLVAARHNKFGVLIFGVGFHVSNLLCYALGILLGLVVEWTGRKPKR